MIYLSAIFVYLAVLSCIGVYKSRQVRTQEDFTVAGRTLSPWVMVCTMLAVWIGTGSIVANAGKTYEVGMAGLFLPLGTLAGMILLSFIATRARNIEALSVPEIIGRRYGPKTRLLAVIALVMAYMVIVSYQFNAGGMVLEVIAGKKDKVPLRVGDTLTGHQVNRGYLQYQPAQDWTGSAQVTLDVKDGASGQWLPAAMRLYVEVVPSTAILELKHSLGQTIEALEQQIADDPNATDEDRAQLEQLRNTRIIKRDTYTRLIVTGHDVAGADAVYRLADMPEQGMVYLHEPRLTAGRATMMAAAFIIGYTMLAGLMSLAYADIVTGIVITVTLLIAFPVLLVKAGGLEGMQSAFAAMGDRPGHMKLLGVFSPAEYINYLLPVFLLVMGDANQYQRIFAGRNARGARSAVIAMIFVAILIEELIITEAWFASSLIPDPENGRYVLIYAARHFMPLALGLVFMVTVVGIIISTADSFLLVPATTFIEDVYLTYVNRKASQRRIVWMSRLMVLLFGIIAWMISLAFSASTTVFQKAMYAYTVYGSAITPCLVAALFWKRATTAGAISSILAGTMTTLLWEEAIKGRLPTELAKLDAVLPAITLSVACLVVVSLCTRRQYTTADKPV